MCKNEIFLVILYKLCIFVNNFENMYSARFYIKTNKAVINVKVNFFTDKTVE